MVYGGPTVATGRVEIAIPVAALGRCSNSVTDYGPPQYSIRDRAQTTLCPGVTRDAID